VRFPPEFKLAVACCRWPPSPRHDEAVKRAASGVDWVRLLKVAARHRVEGLVHDALGRAGIAPPPAVAGRLGSAALGIARENLVFAAEAGRLAGAFGEAAIPVLFLKGVTLNLLAYGTLAIKKAADLDLAVESASYARSVGVLRQSGYVCAFPGAAASDADILAAASRNKHSIWSRNGVAVELHCSLVDSPLMLPGLTAAGEPQNVEIAPRILLPTLGREALFAYLCVHGATHAWSRLKWIADLAALLKDEQPAGIEHLYRRSIELGAGRAGGQALLLCADLFDTALPPALDSELRGSRAHRYLAQVALKSMLRGGGETELDELTFGTAAIHLSHFRLMAGWRFKAAELKRKLAPPAGAAPDYFAPLAAVPAWLLRRARRAGGGR
jgi:hypothetical protein